MHCQCCSLLQGTSWLLVNLCSECDRCSSLNAAGQQEYKRTAWVVVCMLANRTGCLQGLEAASRQRDGSYGPSHVHRRTVGLIIIVVVCRRSKFPPRSPIANINSRSPLANVVTLSQSLRIHLTVNNKLQQQLRLFLVCDPRFAVGLVVLLAHQLLCTTAQSNYCRFFRLQQNDVISKSSSLWHTPSSCFVLRSSLLSPLW